MTDPWAAPDDHDPLCPSWTDRMRGWSCEGGVWKQTGRSSTATVAGEPLPNAKRAGYSVVKSKAKTLKQQHWEKNRRKWRYGSFTSRYPKKCWIIIQRLPNRLIPGRYRSCAKRSQRIGWTARWSRVDRNATRGALQWQIFWLDRSTASRHWSPGPTAGWVRNSRKHYSTPAPPKCTQVRVIPAPSK